MLCLVVGTSVSPGRLRHIYVVHVRRIFQFYFNQGLLEQLVRITLLWFLFVALFLLGCDRRKLSWQLVHHGAWTRHRARYLLHCFRVSRVNFTRLSSKILLNWQFLIALWVLLRNFVEKQVLGEVVSLSMLFLLFWLLIHQAWIAVAVRCIFQSLFAPLFFCNFVVLQTLMVKRSLDLRNLRRVEHSLHFVQVGVERL